MGDNGMSDVEKPGSVEAFMKNIACRDENYFADLQELIDRHKIDLKTLLTHYIAFIRRRDLPRLLAYYELFKLIKDLPGSIAEVGVFIGNGVFTWAKLMETFFPGVRGRKVFGFDNFSGYTQEVEACDVEPVEYVRKIIGNFEVDFDLVQNLERLTNLDSLIPGVQRVKIYNGDLEQIFSTFTGENYGVRLSALIVDVNLYRPTKLALEKLYPLVTKGGIVVFPGYGVKPWEGESRAVDEFLSDKNGTLKGFDFANYPCAYFVKS